MEEQEIKGQCIKTAKTMGLLQSDYVYERGYCIDIEGRQLKIFKAYSEKVKEQYDLERVRWTDDAMTQNLRSGYRHLVQDDGVALLFDRVLPGVNDYPHPLAVGFDDGDFILLWFAS